MNPRVSIIGSGPNGLAAAAVLVRAGARVRVFEAEDTIGGAARTLPLTLPGFLHDFGSAVHPLAVGSPFLSRLPLADYGLKWIHSPAPLAHPLDDGPPAILARDFASTDASLDGDGPAWRELFEPFASHWPALARDALRPLSIPNRPFLMAEFGLQAIRPAQSLLEAHFRGERARALFAGIAAHSGLRLTEPLSAAFGIILGAAGHAVGWPIPRGGSRSITNALASYVEAHGASIQSSTRIDRLCQLPDSEVVLCDIGPLQLGRIARDVLPASYRSRLALFRYGPGAFKMDFALSEPIPWRSPECRLAATVHLGGTAAEIIAAEDQVSAGRHPERPFVLLAQPSLFDPTRAPEGLHTAWAYCHVPNGSIVDMSNLIEDQIERFAPGFRDIVIARTALSPSTLELLDPNLVGGDVNGGLLNLPQLISRSTLWRYSTPVRGLYLCSASTPPGGGVHGMCGYWAAHQALSYLRLKLK